ncbi:MAG: thiol:disulfide interchange protein, partial [Bacteroidales bacterium]|nr:thiol:disulfide interchange protein [Bacteroidales bacterium]
MKKLIVLLLIVQSIVLQAQVHSPVTWKHELEDLGNQEYQLVFTATVEDGWHLYGLNIPEGGPVATSVNMEENSNISLIDKVKSAVKIHSKFDELFAMNIEYFDGDVVLKQKFKANNSTTVKGYIEFMVCNDATCLPPTEYDFESTVNVSKPKKSTVKVTHTEPKEEAKETKKIEQGAFANAIAPKEKNDIQATNTEQQETKVVVSDNSPEDDSNQESNDKEEKKSLLSILLLGLGGGLLAALTPCVYPMIPLTMAVFYKEGQKNSVSVFNGLAFGISIVIIYALVGFIVGLTGIDIGKLVASNQIVNIVIFALFILFAISFFGAFEIVLPSSWANKIDHQADKGGLLAPFFMALATVVVSFSCTGIIAGSILGAGLQGDLITPTVGMFGFGLSFALPFALLAIFPNTANKMPKSGGWMNSIKVAFAFILLISSLIFLGNARLGFISRDFIISLAIVMFILLGFYLIGKLKFSHDSPIQHIGTLRIFLAILAFSGGVYLVPGLFGKTLGPLEPFLPEQKNQAVLSLGGVSQPASHNVMAVELCTSTPKYSDKLHLPHGLVGYFEYEEGMACAKQQNKP